MTKERLRQYRHIKNERNQLFDELRELEASIASPGGGKFDGVPHTPSGKSDPVGKAATRHIELKKLYEAKLEELTALQLEIEATIEVLPLRERQMIRGCFIDCLSVEKAGERIKLSRAHAYRIYNRALSLLESA